VGDAQTLYDKLFAFPPTDPGHESYRRSFVALALERNKTRAQWLMFADMLDGLERFDDRPLDAWMVLRKAPRPALTAPRVEAASVPGIQGFAGLPTPAGFGWFNMVLAAALVLSLGYALWQRGDAMKAGRLRDALEAEQAANAGLAERTRAAEDAQQRTAETLEDYERRIAERAKSDGALARELAAIRRREKERRDAINSGGSAQRSDDEWVRGIAEPASVGASVSADPAAAAPEGVLGEVPGATGGDAEPGSRPQ
jgi:hypothetical protein